jgi:hypothetical protein
MNSPEASYVHGVTTMLSASASITFTALARCPRTRRDSVFAVLDTNAPVERYTSSTRSS